MRIISGKFGSRLIQAVKGMNTRPTSDKIREAIFSRIGPYFDGGQMLDLFAGSGAVSLEAISRGLDHAVLVDKDHTAIKTIQSNIGALQAEKQCAVVRSDVMTFLLQQHTTFDLIYMDPPYALKIIEEILIYLDKHNLVASGGNVICESSKEDQFLDHYGSLVRQKEVCYGITKISYYKREEKQ